VQPGSRAPSSPGLSIGALAAATGLGVETLRAWERRYGRPRPARRASGHRRYGPAEVAWLRLVAQAVGAGARPSEVVPLSLPALRRLVPAAAAASAAPWLVSVRRFDATGLARSIVRAHAAAPNPAAFLDDDLVPFLAAIGARWAGGRLGIRHEHFATEVVGAVLARLLARVRVSARAPALVLATLPGERHGLGLAMAALVAADRGVRPRSLGPDTPPEEIVAAVDEGRADAVAIAVSAATGGPAARRGIARLRALLPAGVPLLVGGGGVVGPRRLPVGVRRCGSFRDLAQSLAEVGARPGRPRERRGRRRGSGPDPAPPTSGRRLPSP